MCKKKEGRNKYPSKQTTQKKEIYGRKQTKSFAQPDIGKQNSWSEKQSELSGKICS